MTLPADTTAAPSFADAREDASAPGLARVLRVAAWLAFLGGALQRLMPFVLEGGRRIAERFPTEDAYLMFTIARSLALGQGFSVADGTTPTNGTQPLATLLWAGLFRLVGGARLPGVTLIVLAEIAISVAVALVLRRLVLRLFPARPDVALLAAGIWFGSPLVVPHAMNCLETGLYALSVLGVAHLLVEPGERVRPWPWSRTLLLGLAFGGAFWARNDAVFLIAAGCLTFLWNGIDRAAQGGRGAVALGARLRRVVAAGVVSVLVASPWLLFNLLRFGHIVPVSGRSEGRTGHLASNLPRVPAVLLEYANLVVPIPHALERRPVIVAVSLAILTAVALLGWRAWRRAGAPVRSLGVLGGLYGAALVAYYGIFFGAEWFLQRYLMPLSVFLSVTWAVGIARLAAGLARQSRLAGAALVLGAASLTVALGLRSYTTFPGHQHFQAVRWIEANVPETTWVAAVQTGTIGFFHDRTINLDGKVNPAALQALIEGRHGPYIVSTPAQYLVDWAGVVDLLTDPAMGEHFEAIVVDPEQNLSVLARKDRPR